MKKIQPHDQVGGKDKPKHTCFTDGGQGSHVCVMDVEGLGLPNEARKFRIVNME